MISIAMIASSTSNPSARINEPSVMRSRTRSVAHMMTSTMASVNGTAVATTIPTRHPSAIRLTTITIPSASRKVFMNWSTAEAMFTAWSVTGVSDMPSGSSEDMLATSDLSDFPRSRPFQPSRITTPSRSAGSPSLRIRKVAGSS